MKKRVLVAEKRACGARQASTPRQQGMHWELPGTGQGPQATYISLSESDLFPGDSAAPACLGSTRTSASSEAFQIVQRRQSGWVNWGTSGENECPELPVGVQIKTAYGMFSDGWQHVADQLETAPTAHRA